MIVVFGGSFNPPTIAHYKIAEYIQEKLSCDQFFFLPVGEQYPKKGLIENFHRIEMLKLVCENLDRTSVCEIETSFNRVLTTFETLSLLKRDYPLEDIAFVLGADNLNQLNDWNQVGDLLKNFKIIVFKRDDLDVESIIEEEFLAYKDKFIILDSFGEMNVSSSLYRENLENEHLVLQTVSEYIKKHKLYGRH